MIMNRHARLITPLILLLTAVINTFAATPDSLGSRYLAEADAFLAGMQPGLQQRQTAAIHQAISGDLAALSAARNARNSAASLPPDIIRTDLTHTLSLFRSQQYAADTIPLLVYFHGGGWTIGSINSCSRYCAAMAAEGIAVLAVDYRLAPEHPFPAGLNDCMAAVDTAIANLDRWQCSRVSLGGDSSGGNLAIATAMNYPKGTLDALVTFYPVTKAYPDNTPSRSDYGCGYGLDSLLMDAFNDAYTCDITNPLVSPAHATDRQLSVLPPTLIISADRDILRDQGQEFARRLASLGINVDHETLPGTVHLFITVPGQPTAFTRAVARAAAHIKGRRQSNAGIENSR